MTALVGRTSFAGALFTLPLVALGVAWCLPDAAGLILVAAGLACVLAALASIHSAAVRDRALGALRGGLRSAAIRAERPFDEWRRGASALALVVPAFVLAVILLPVALWRPALDFKIGSPPRVESPPPRQSGADESDTTGPVDASGSAAAESGAGGEPSSGGATDTGSGLRSSPSEASLSDPWLLRRVLLTATPSRDDLPTGNLGALYLRGIVLPSIDDAGRFNDDDEAFIVRRDADDGDSDGWTRIGDRAPAAGAIDFDIRQFAIAHDATGWTILHAPPVAAAVARRTLRSATEAAVLLPPAKGEWVDYRVRCRAPTSAPYPTDRTHVAARDARTLALPAGIPVVDLLGAIARKVTNGAGTDLARVRSVVRHLRENWAYEPIDEELTGMAALDVFVADRKGTCVQFAEASAVMLRSIGIPARVVHGFLARNWDASLGHYFARGRDYHAWIEVDFDGCGWVTFDATPIAPGDLEVSNAQRPAPTTDASEPAPDGLSGLTDALQSANGGIRDSVSEHPGLWAVALLVSVLTLARVLKSRHERLNGIDTSSAWDRTPWGRLLAALARHGHRRRPAQTALEFAAHVAASDTALAPFVDLTRRQQAARFGGVELGPDELGRIDALRAML
ncbi:MAG: transglutaminase domain-containing protein [Planctomycetes bacterium]|nr:transglutaminase domain-containing protein [Planctomycetota bacterium]